MMIDTNERYPVSYISRLRMGTDGNGIRTLILFQDCSLRCKYCINPFTWNGSREPQMMSAQEIYDNILLDRPYMLATNGGVTFGGGEPLLHSKVIKEFATINGGQFTLFIETALNVPREKLEDVMDCIDMFYVDIKTMDFDIYKTYTGGDLHVAVDNLQHLVDKVGQEKIVVRIPKIPGFTDVEDQLNTKKLLYSQLGIIHFNEFEYQI